ncbi:hypothetical protein PS903_03129 [Pseudomonas fluorescens]|nr:hypothetical protein PS903_03129 [Pseudomonas fluorescens]
MSRLPLIGVTFCSGQNGLHAYHISGDTHVRAAALAAKGMLASFPSLAALPVPSDILDGLDDILFTGSLSNIEPFRAGGSANVSVTAHDSARATTLSLTRDFVEAGLCARPLQWQSVPSDADASNNA